MELNDTFGWLFFSGALLAVSIVVLIFFIVGLVSTWRYFKGKVSNDDK